MTIDVAPGVVFTKIAVEMIDVLIELDAISDAYGFRPVITGAGDTQYPKGKVHDMGYAIDVRTSNIKHPKRFVDDLREALGFLSPHYVVLYGDPAHKDHIHIGFSWWFSLEERVKRGDDPGV
jgi:hypothetical protein